MRSRIVWVLLLMFQSVSVREIWPCCGAAFGPVHTPDSKDSPNPPGCGNSEKCDPCQTTGSPAFMMSGNYRFEQTDLTLGGRGPAIAVYRVYNSQDRYVGPVGKGWHHSLIIQAAKMKDDLGQYVLIRMPSASRVVYTKTGQTYTPPTGHTETLSDNEDGTLDLTWGDGTVWHFSADGWIETITDRYGNAATYTYATINGQKRPVGVASGSRSITIAWNGAGRIRSVTDHTGRSVEYTYDQDNNLLNVEDPAGRVWTYQYYVSGPYALLESVELQGLPYASATYDSYRRVIGYMEDGENWTIEVQADRTVKRDASSNEWQFFYDSEGFITKVVDPAGGTRETSYYTDHKVEMATDQVGVKTYYTHNPNGTIASVTKDYQGSLAVRYDYAYDTNFPEEVVSIGPRDPATGERNPDWQGSEYDYYAPGSPAAGALHHLYRVRSDGSRDTMATYTYTALGQIETMTDPAGAVTSYQYNQSTGDLTSITLPPNSDSGQNRVIQYARDEVGRLQSVTDAEGKTTSYTYEPMDRIATVTLPKPGPESPFDFTTSYSYDTYVSGVAYTQQTDPNARVTKQGFDQHGHLLRSIDALNNATAFTYADAQLVSVTDANDNVTTYTFNSTRQLQSTRFSDGAIESYSYYANDQLKTKTDRENQTITYKYDSHNRMTEQIYPNATSIKYIYQGQKLIRVEDGYAGETHTFDHDTAYRLTQETQGTRGTITYSYTAGDRLLGYAVTGGASTQYSYYADGSLKTIQWSPVVGDFRYDYTPSGRYSTITFPNGQQRQYSYDDQGRLLQLANVHPTAGNLATFAYGYDVDNYTGTNAMLGQRTSLTMNFPAANQTDALHKYYYDSNYQLTRVDYPQGEPFNGEIHQWTYDAIGNRLTNTVNDVTQTYTYYKNAGNPKNGQRLQSDGANAYTFDANGNTTSRIGADETFNFIWDLDDRISVVSGSESAAYEYDHQGRRATKTLPGSSDTFLYHDLNLVARPGDPQVQYLFGPGIDEPLARADTLSLELSASDALGSLVLLADAQGAAKNAYLYDAWGQLRRATELSTNFLGYTGREFAEAGLWYFRMRYYDPGTGRFLSGDPASNMGHFGSYRYPGLNPVRYTDPFGMFQVADDCYRRVNGTWVAKAVYVGIANFRQALNGQKCKTLLQSTVDGAKKTLYDLVQDCDRKGMIKCPCHPPRTDVCGETPGFALTPTVYIHDGSFMKLGCPFMMGLTTGPTILHECLHNMYSAFRFVEPHQNAAGPSGLFWKVMDECTGYKE
ncbi:MAG: RHS repeat protein [Acidobacteria bacterium]|nr:RHS repeat protein [Acidobacteriota bacterium]